MITDETAIVPPATRPTKWWLYPLIAIGALAALLVIIGAIVVLVSFQLSSTGRLPNTVSPLSYVSEKAIPEQGSICAGAVISFSEIYKANDAPARVSLYYELRNPYTSEVLREANEPTDNTLVLPGDIGKTFTLSVVFSETAGLPAGQYELWRFGQADGRIPSFYYVPFEVKECP